MNWKDVREGMIVQLSEDDPERPLPGSHAHPKKGYYRVLKIRPPIFGGRTGKPEWDSVADIQKCTRDGRPIGHYVHTPFLAWSMWAHCEPVNHG